MSDGLNDAELVRGLQQGNRDAWDALCQQYNRRIWRYVARLVGPDENAVAEVFQETMLAVAKAGSRIETGTRLWAWLARISHNQSAQYWRGQYRSKEVATEHIEATKTEQPGPVEILVQADMVQDIRALMAEMNSDYAAVLTAKYIDGDSVEEIVAHYGGTSESIRSRLARARQDFRQRFIQLERSREDISVSSQRLADE